MIHHLHLVFAPFPSTQILEFLALVVAGFIGVGLARRARGTWGRAFVLILMLLALANPSLVKEQREPLKDVALLVIDESASMQMGDRGSQSTKAAAVLAQKLSAFKDLDVETLHVKGREETDLFQAIDQKLANIPKDRLAGVLAITDGEIHDKPPLKYEAPLHVLLVGHKDEVDRRLVVKEVPAYGIVGKKVLVTLRVEDQPKPQSTSAVVSFHRDTGDVVTMSVPVGQDVTLDMPITHAGVNFGVLSTEPLPQEITPINNSVAVHVNGIRDRLRVLLVSGEPHIGERTWRNFLKADPAVDLIHFTILRSPTKHDGVPNSELALIAFPVHELFETKLKSFDLIILDRFRNQSLVPDEYLTNIARYVENGGALLVSNATDEAVPVTGTSPLAHILPVESTSQILTGSFVPDITTSGQRHPVTAFLSSNMARDLWGPWYRQIAGHAARGDVLMSGIGNQPLLVLDHVGQGRVAQFLSDEFWLWARQGNGPQADLLRRVAHWLVQEPDLDENALRAHIEQAENGWSLTITKHSLRDVSDDVTVIDPKAQAIPVHLVEGSTPGVLSAVLPVEQTGLYHVKADDQDILVMAGATDAPEFGDMRATTTWVEPFIKASGGGSVWLENEADSLAGTDIRRRSAGLPMQGDNWIGLKQNGQYHITGSKAYPLVSPWLFILALLGFSFFAWWREGR